MSLDDGLKQRVIGAIILLALAVIFIPVFFDQDRMEPIDRISQIPPPPEIRPVVIDDPAPLADMDPAPDPQAMYVPDEKEVVPDTPEPPGLKTDGTPKAWVLQIASLRQAESAIKLRDKLIKAGYSAYIRESSYKNGKVHRVFVGPKLDKEALIQEKRRIDKAYKVEALLLEFKAK